MPERVSRRMLFRWMGWFALANAAVFGLIGLRYFSGFTSGETALGWVYLGLVYPAHHVLLAVVPLFVVLGTLVLVWPQRRLILRTGAVLYALMAAMIMLDSLLWAESRFHLNALTLQILGWQSWAFVAVILLTGLVFETLLGNRVWAWTVARKSRCGKVAAALCVGAVVGSQLIHAWADASYYVPVTSVGQQLPVYEGFTAKRLLTRWGLVDPEKSREREIARRLSRQLAEGAGQVLNYPLRPIECDNTEPLNVLLVLADALRSDMLQPETMPYLASVAGSRFAEFKEHFSGGNSSRMGVFSLFYGLPPGYWSSFEGLQRSPVLIDQFQARDFELGLFSSSTMYRPVSLDRTAFAGVSNLRLRTEPADAPAWERDTRLTREWFEWLARRDPDRPFFGFLFYDATNAQDYPPGTDAGSAELPAVGEDFTTRFADYRKSARFVDGQIESVMADLGRRGLRDRTIVIISSDHGEEFDESGQGLQDHGSGYTRYQLQVPFLVQWPGRPPRSYAHRTSHYDLVPTLMQHALGCSGPANDYASGRDLFSEQDWPWLLVGSYYNYAVLEPDQITITYPNGRFEVRDWNYRLLNDPVVRGDILQAVTRENSRFYRK